METGDGETHPILPLYHKSPSVSPFQLHDCGEPSSAPVSVSILPLSSPPHRPRPPPMYPAASVPLWSRRRWEVCNPVPLAHHACGAAEVDAPRPPRRCRTASPTSFVLPTAPQLLTRCRRLPVRSSVGDVGYGDGRDRAAPCPLF